MIDKIELPAEEEKIEDQVDDIEQSTVEIDETFLTEEEEIALMMKKRRVATLRNKVYIFFLALFLFMFWPTFLTPIEKVRGEGAFKMFSLNPIEGMHRNRGEGGLLTDIEEVDKEIEEQEQLIKKTEVEKRVIMQLVDEKKQNAIINCLNFNVCGDMSDALKDQLDFLRIFLIVGGLQTEKMGFNQKAILRNLNEYMLKSPKGDLYGSVSGINFDAIQEVNEEFKLQKLGLRMEIEFTNKDSLFEFLDSMENKIFIEVPIMYIIESMNYDVVNYDEPQTIGVNVSVYFFTGEIPPLQDDLNTE